MIQALIPRKSFVINSSDRIERREETRWRIVLKKISAT